MTMETMKDKIGGFPIWVFPPLIQEVIEATHEALNFPVQYTAASILSAVSTAIGTSCYLHVKETWIERPILYVAIVGNPGSCKSHPISFALDPILQRDIMKRHEYSRALKEYQMSLQSSDRNITIQKPVCLQRIVQDVTIEELFSIMEKNPLGVCFYCDELALWFEQMGRYKKSVDVGYWLSFFIGKSAFIDRKTTDEKLTVDTTFVNVIGSIQPSVMKKYLIDSNKDNGLLSRFMIIYGDEDEDMPYDSVVDMPSGIIERYNDLISKLLHDSESSMEVSDAVYHLSDEAKQVYTSWSRLTTDIINNKDSIEIRNFFPKVKSYVFRIALILQILYETCENRNSTLLIEGNIMDKACSIGNYLMSSSRYTISSFIVDDKISVGYKAIYDRLPEDIFKKSLVNDIIRELHLSESLADKFCKDMQGIMIEKIKFATYRKLRM